MKGFFNSLLVFFDRHIHFTSSLMVSGMIFLLCSAEVRPLTTGHLAFGDARELKSIIMRVFSIVLFPYNKLGPLLRFVRALLFVGPFNKSLLLFRLFLRSFLFSSSISACTTFAILLFSFCCVFRPVYFSSISGILRCHFLRPLRMKTFCFCLPSFISGVEPAVTACVNRGGHHCFVVAMKCVRFIAWAKMDVVNRNTIGSMYEFKTNNTCLCLSRITV